MPTPPRRRPTAPQDTAALPPHPNGYSSRPNVNVPPPAAGPSRMGGSSSRAGASYRTTGFSRHAISTHQPHPATPGRQANPILVDTPSPSRSPSAPIINRRPRTPPGFRSFRETTRLSAANSTAATRLVRQGRVPITPEQTAPPVPATNGAADGAASTTTSPLRLLADARRADGADPTTSIALTSHATAANPTTPSSSLIAENGSDAIEVQMEDDDYPCYEFDNSALLELLEIDRVIGQSAPRA
jgi:hypothetical protein